MTLEGYVEFVQQLEMILDFSETTHDHTIPSGGNYSVAHTCCERQRLKNVCTAISNMT